MVYPDLPDSCPICPEIGLSSGVKKGVSNVLSLYPPLRDKEDDISYICGTVTLCALKFLLTLSFKVSISDDDPIIIVKMTTPTKKK